MKTFKNIFIDGNTDIVIPQLQRDYVQGQRADIIYPLLSSLVDAITDQSKDEVHLNYIYGYGTEEDGRLGFVPVDGQQRLTTLWLLHLYMYSKFVGADKFGVNLIFRAREYAGHFTCELKKHCAEIIGANDIKKAITSAYWFITEWQYDKTVDSMLKTLAAIEKMLKNVHQNEFHFDRISFQFLNMTDLGLTDDIYVKMNGRGKPLTYFENLKSWMDSEGDAEWKEKIDNEWAAFFWDNRNKNQEHPEEIDDEQQRLFYSLSLIYWVQHLESMLFDMKVDDFDGTTSYLRSLPSGYSDSDSLPATPSIDNIRAKILNILRVGKLAIPLYWVEKWGIFSKDVMEWIKESMNVLSDIAKIVNDQTKELYFNFDHAESTTLVYDIAMDSAYYESTIPFLYGLVKTPENCKKDIHQWLRLLRNLILNSSIGYDRVLEAFNSIDTLSESISKCTDAAPVLSTLRGIAKHDDTIKKLIPFSRQMKEEVKKATIIELAEIDVMEDIENIHTFRGRVSFIFDFLKGDEWNADSLKAYRDILAIVFPDEKKNRTGFIDNLVRRVLVTYEPHFIGNDPGGGKWKHVGNGSEDWKNFLCNSEYNSCIKAMIEGIRTSCCEISHSGVEGYLKEVLDNSSFDYSQYWHFFAKFSGVWSFMEDKLSSTWDDKSSSKIILLKKTRFGDGYDHAELRAYSLYLAWMNDEELKQDLRSNGWSGPRFWPHGKWDAQKDTCVFFEKNDGQGNKMAIDVYFRKTKADDFAVDMMLRPKDGTEEEQTTYARTEEYYRQKKLVLDELSGYEFDGYNFISQDTFSWDGIKEELRRIINVM